MSQPRPNEQLGRMAYETYFEASSVAHVPYPVWESLHSAQQDGWQHAAKVLYDAGYAAGMNVMREGAGIHDADNV